MLTIIGVVRGVLQCNTLLDDFGLQRKTPRGVGSNKGGGGELTSIEKFENWNTGNAKYNVIRTNVTF